MSGLPPDQFFRAGEFTGLAADVHAGQQAELAVADADEALILRGTEARQAMATSQGLMVQQEVSLIFGEESWDHPVGEITARVLDSQTDAVLRDHDPRNPHAVDALRAVFSRGAIRAVMVEVLEVSGWFLSGREHDAVIARHAGNSPEEVGRQLGVTTPGARYLIRAADRKLVDGPRPEDLDPHGLTPLQRRLVTLREEKGLSRAEICELMPQEYPDLNWNENALKQRMIAVYKRIAAAGGDARGAGMTDLQVAVHARLRQDKTARQIATELDVPFRGIYNARDAINGRFGTRYGLLPLFDAEHIARVLGEGSVEARIVQWSQDGFSLPAIAERLGNIRSRTWVGGVRQDVIARLSATLETPATEQ